MTYGEGARFSDVISSWLRATELWVVAHLVNNHTPSVSGKGGNSDNSGGTVGKVDHVSVEINCDVIWMTQVREGSSTSDYWHTQTSVHICFLDFRCRTEICPEHEAIWRGEGEREGGREGGRGRGRERARGGEERERGGEGGRGREGGREGEREGGREQERERERGREECPESKVS